MIMGSCSGTSTSTLGGGGGKDIGVLSRNNFHVSTNVKDDTRKAVETVMRDFQTRYGLDTRDTGVAKLAKKDEGVLAYADASGNVSINDKYLDYTTMDIAYQSSVQTGFHPSSGKYSGMEAVIAHELGHSVTARLGQLSGGKDIDAISKEIVERAARKSKKTDIKSWVGKTSGYAKESNAEAVAEAMADVYCNGNRAAPASKSIVRELDAMFAKANKK